MERWAGGHNRRGCETVNPSFSSSLLDAIYRSIDEGDDMGTCRKANMAQQQQHKGGEAQRVPTNYSHRRDHYKAVTATAEKCYSTTITEKNRNSTATATVTEKVVLRRRGYGADTAPECCYLRHGYTKQVQQQREQYVLNSTSSSSDSSYGGFSSSEAESVFLSGRPKPVKVPPPLPRQERPLSSLETKKESSIRSRIRASKIYTELKKAKSPVSPGGRLAAFLNTLFTSAGHPKKPKTASSSSLVAVNTHPVAAGEDSACSSASSYSRSCLSKNPSSRGKPANGAKRSVRFYPVSVIVDDNLRPCGHKSLYKDYDYGGGPYISRPLPPLAAIKVRDSSAVARTGEEGKRADEAARDPIKRRYSGVGVKDDEEEDEDDAASYSSSDLFELENFTAIGSGAAYGDELPVYETTHLRTNRAIARGLIV